MSNSAEDMQEVPLEELFSPEFLKTVHIMNGPVDKYNGIDAVAARPSRYKIKEYLIADVVEKQKAGYKICCWKCKVDDIGWYWLWWITAFNLKEEKK
jgi:hypothetical protein